jgi:hypothetical protein
VATNVQPGCVGDGEAGDGPETDGHQVPGQHRQILPPSHRFNITIKKFENV